MRLKVHGASGVQRLPDGGSEGLDGSDGSLDGNMFISQYLACLLYSPPLGWKQRGRCARRRKVVSFTKHFAFCGVTMPFSPLTNIIFFYQVSLPSTCCSRLAQRLPITGLCRPWCPWPLLLLEMRTCATVRLVHVRLPQPFIHSSSRDKVTGEK